MFRSSAQWPTGVDFVLWKFTPHSPFAMRSRKLKLKVVLLLRWLWYLSYAASTVKLLGRKSQIESKLVSLLIATG
jgi:hypothetical protein